MTEDELDAQSDLESVYMHEIRKLRAENEALRKVLEAAREVHLQAERDHQRKLTMVHPHWMGMLAAALDGADFILEDK